MDISLLLNGTNCACGRHHQCSIKHVVIEKNAVSRLPELIDGYKSILLVADRNTYSVCGNTVEESIKGRLSNALIYERDGLLIPNERAIGEMEDMLTSETELIIGVGSGVIQDLCKYVSFKHKLPYYIVATAPSMDGYASAGAAMIIDNMKVTYNAHVPEAIIADTDVIKNAPIEMIQSGYGDIIGKLSCLNDWRLSQVVNDEYFCQYIYDLTMEMVNNIKDCGKKLVERDEKSIKLLMEALVGTGVAMAYAGNSRPASGSEHHFSHFFEVIGIMNNEPYFMHGTDVAYSAVYTARMREEILRLDKPVQKSDFNEYEWETSIRKIYGRAADGIIKLQNSTGCYKKDYIAIYQSKWNEIKATLSEAPKADELLGYLESVGLSIGQFEDMYSREKINNAKWFAKDLKDRYTVLWLYYSLFYI